MLTQDIKQYARILKTTYIKNAIDEFLVEAEAEGWDVATSIETLLYRECEGRRINGITRRRQAAHFPYQMYFATFATNHLTAEVVREIRILKTLEFMKERTNVILVGNPGVGKTALAIALGNAAVEESKNVAFINVSQMLLEIKEAADKNVLFSYEKKFISPDLVILDDLGYCSFNKQAGEMLFNLLSARNEKGSMIITTNLTFDRWCEVFEDPILTGAIVDRLAHKAHVVDMTGESYRMIETQAWLNNQKENKEKEETEQ